MQKTTAKIIQNAIHAMTIPMTDKLSALDAIERQHGLLARARDRRVARQDWLQQIASLAENGVIALCEWSRDCDMCESTSRRLIEATTELIAKRNKQVIARNRYTEARRRCIAIEEGLSKRQFSTEVMEAIADAYEKATAE